MPTRAGTAPLLAVVIGLLTTLALVLGSSLPVRASTRAQYYPEPPLSTIRGRIVDGETLALLSGNVDLWRCDGGECIELVRSYYSYNGDFRFEYDSQGRPFGAGTYQITVKARLYEEYKTAPFPVADGEEKDLGDLPLTMIPTIGSISGRVVDQKTGNPPPANDYYVAYIQLFRCSDETDVNCSEIDSTYVGSDGRFRFTPEATYGVDPTPGIYRVDVSAITYDNYHTGPFTVGEDEHKDLGDLAIVPQPRIDSISGQLVDAIGGEPLSGTEQPYAWVTLEFCHPEYYYCYDISSQPADADGGFRFNRTREGFHLGVGTYRIYASAEQYSGYFSDPFTVGEDESKDLGLVKVQSYPVRFGKITPCTSIPSRGGTCRYSVQITNGTATKLDGAAWSMIYASDPGSFSGFSRFQAGVPVRVQLASNKTQTVTFQFQVPVGVSDGAYMCMEAFVSKDPSALLFKTHGFTDLFCVEKSGSGGFKQVPAERARELFRRINGLPALPSSKR